MINSVTEWLEILFFSIIIAAVCSGLIVLSLLMAFVYLIKAVVNMDFKFIIE